MSDDAKAVERWREDFPIRWDEDHYLTRRELAKFLTLGSALLTGATGALALASRMGARAEWPAAKIPAAAHLSCAVRYETGGTRIECPCHRGFFAVDDGRPIAGPPTRPLPRVRLESRADGVYAVGMEI